MWCCSSFEEWDGEDDNSDFTAADMSRELKGCLYDYNFAEVRNPYVLQDLEGGGGGTHDMERCW